MDTEYTIIHDVWRLLLLSDEKKHMIIKKGVSQNGGGETKPCACDKYIELLASRSFQVNLGTVDRFKSMIYVLHSVRSTMYLD